MKPYFLFYVAAWCFALTLPVSAKGNVDYSLDVTHGIANTAPKLGPPQTMNKEQCISYATRLFWQRNRRAKSRNDFNLNFRLLSLHKKYCNTLTSQVPQQSFVDDEDLGVLIVKPLAEKPQE
jgi:hypothetical protein